MMDMNANPGCYVIGVDVGSTKVKCCIYDSNAVVIASVERNVELLHPRLGWCEYEPNNIWTRFIEVVRACMEKAHVGAEQIQCLGISTQRNSFLMFDSQTGKPLCNFISWQDLRANEYVNAWNFSYTMKFFRAFAAVAYFFTRQSRFAGAKALDFKDALVTLRLRWLIDNNIHVREALSAGRAQYAGVDTWLLYKLTEGREYAMDYSSASATGLYDPFLVTWSQVILRLFSIPSSLFPPVKDTSGHFGICSEKLFGAPIPIMCMVADQSASMFAEGCSNEGDMKLTMGTGAFLDVNTGSKPHGSMSGLYPLVGWSINGQLTYLAEGMIADCGNIIEWGQGIGLYNSPDELAELVRSVKDSDGVYFVPAFNGLQPPIDDPQACGAFLGLRQNTRRPHLVRAIVDSIAFRVKLLYDMMCRERNVRPTCIKVDGGVSNSEFVMQEVSDLLAVSTVTSKYEELSCLGAAFLAGLAAGVWKDTDALAKVHTNSRTYKPNHANGHHSMDVWSHAVERARCWYS